jgi:hypothetical protein
MWALFAGMGRLRAMPMQTQKLKHACMATGAINRCALSMGQFMQSIGKTMLPPLTPLERISRRISILRQQMANSRSKDDRISLNGAMVELIALRKEIELNEEP